MKAPLDKLTKIDAARSQLATAINLFFDDVDPISVHSLACASAEILETMCRNNGKQTFFTHTRESNPKFTSKEIRETLNKCKNWFKHADKDHGDVLTDFSDVLNDYAIFMASHDYDSIENWKPIEIQVFQLWFSAVYKKHMDPRPEIVQQLFPDMDKKIAESKNFWAKKFWIGQERSQNSPWRSWRIGWTPRTPRRPSRSSNGGRTKPSLGRKLRRTSTGERGNRERGAEQVQRHLRAAPPGMALRLGA